MPPYDRDGARPATDMLTGGVEPQVRRTPPAPPAPSTLGRADRIATRTRDANWKKPPRRIATSECITCDTCLRSCPPEFGAIVDDGLNVVIVPELCSGCPSCVMVCPVDCIYVDEDWKPTESRLWDLADLAGGRA